MTILNVVYSRCRSDHVCSVAQLLEQLTNANRMVWTLSHEFAGFTASCLLSMTLGKLFTHCSVTKHYSLEPSSTLILYWSCIRLVVYLLMGSVPYTEHWHYSVGRPHNGYCYADDQLDNYNVTQPVSPLTSPISGLPAI